MKMLARILVSSFLLLWNGCQPTEQRSLINDLPNIIILLADDLGYADLGCYGGIAQTPHLDKLAKEGIRFTDFYAAAPNCSPSRVGLLTGRYPSKMGMYNYMPVGHPMHLRDEAITIAEIVKTKAYATGHFGKWHVSNLHPDADLAQPQPNDQGFDYSLGTTNNANPSHLNPVNFVRNGERVGKMNGYSCQIVVDEAIGWLDKIQSNKSPFLLYLAFHEPHKKVASPPELIAKYEQFSQQDAEYLANIENLDLAIGRLMNFLEENQLNNNTLVLFSSDNGSYRNGSNEPLLGGKSFVYEGGIRVPGILRWKGVIGAGQVISEPASLIDVMPTICDMIRVEHPRFEDLDGVSLQPLFSNLELHRSKPLSWFFYRTTPEIAMRVGNYTILGRDRDSSVHTHSFTKPDMEYLKSMDLEEFELYDLSIDISQSQKLAINSVENGHYFKQKLLERIQELQAAGPYWQDLPPAVTPKKRKSEWRKLRPEGFSN